MNKFEFPPQEGSHKKETELDKIPRSDEEVEEALELESEETQPIEEIRDMQSGPEDTEAVKSAEMPESVEPAETEAAEAAFEQEFSPEEQQEMIDEIDAGTEAYAKAEQERAEQAAEAEEKASPLEMAKRFFAEHREEFDKIAEELNELINKNLIPEAQELASKFLSDVRQKSEKYFGDKADEWFQEYDDLMAKAGQEKSQNRKRRLISLAIEGVDFIPVIGPVKMIAESTKGSTFNGKELKSWSRALHATSGVAFLALDLTGLGALGKSVKAGKLMTRTAALMRKVGLPRQMYKPAYKIGRFVLNNPTAARAADKALRFQIGARSKRARKWKDQVSDEVEDIFVNETQSRTAA